MPELSRQLKFNMAKPEIMGTIMFRFKNFEDSGKQQAVGAVKNNLWTTNSLVSVMPWKGGSTPNTPILGKLESLSRGVKLSWTDNDPDTAYFAIYRFNTGEKTDIVSDRSALKLLTTIRKTGSGIQEFIDYEISNADSVYYIVTALDRLHNE